LAESFLVGCDYRVCRPGRLVAEAHEFSSDAAGGEGLAAAMMLFPDGGSVNLCVSSVDRIEIWTAQRMQNA
jgi:hypothetical protein